MATQIYDQQEILLQDGKEVTLKPLPIAPLRRFMAAFKQIEKLEEGDDGFDIFINCSGIALEANYKGDFDSLRADTNEKKKGEVLSKEYKEYLEDTLDLDTIYKIMEVAGGIKLNDPKLMEQMLAQAQAEGAGTT